MDGIGRERKAIHNMTLALFKRPWYKKVMIPGGWNWQREANNTLYHPGPVEDVVVEQNMIPGGWTM